MGASGHGKGYRGSATGTNEALATAGHDVSKCAKCTHLHDLLLRLHLCLLPHHDNRLLLLRRETAHCRNSLLVQWLKALLMPNEHRGAHVQSRVRIRIRCARY